MSSYLSQPASTSVINYFPVNLHWSACKQCRMQTTAETHGSMHAQAGGQLTNSNVVMRDHHILKTFSFFNQQINNCFKATNWSDWQWEWRVSLAELWGSVKYIRGLPRQPDSWLCNSNQLSTRKSSRHGVIKLLRRWRLSC